MSCSEQLKREIIPWRIFGEFRLAVSPSCVWRSDPFSIIFMMYFLVVDVANVLAGWMEQLLWLPVEDKINALVPAGLLNDFLIGHYGVLSLGLANAFITVLPILSVFFLPLIFLRTLVIFPMSAF